MAVQDSVKAKKLDLARIFKDSVNLQKVIGHDKLKEFLDDNRYTFVGGLLRTITAEQETTVDQKKSGLLKAQKAKALRISITITQYLASKDIQQANETYSKLVEELDSLIELIKSE